tara:strand:+ start:12727 stop:13269 length:543 start_codon:yes stop_codon:yes gene_type:complete
MELKVSHAEATEVLGMLSHLGAKHLPAEAQLYYADGKLNVDSAGNIVSMDASGHWDAVARVPISFIVGVGKKLPTTDPIVFKIVDSRFYIGQSSSECVLQSSAETEISVPLDASISTILKIHFEETPDRIDKAGLRQTVDVALQKANKHVNQAAECLKVLGIRPEDLAEFVKENIKNQKA